MKLRQYLEEEFDFKKKENLSSKEREEFKKRFPNAKCSCAKMNGKYFVYTHRARSPMYQTLQQLPVQQVNLISSSA